MSSILIKDMEIPCEEAEPLRIELYADGTVLVIKEQDDFYEFKAVPVPPHGRLIDADALRYWVDDSAMIAFDYVTRSQINATPTIIPAEPFNNLSKPYNGEGE